MHKAVEHLEVLARAGDDKATLQAIVAGKDRRETLTRRQLVRLLRSASEALSRMEGDDF